MAADKTPKDASAAQPVAESAAPVDSAAPVATTPPVDSAPPVDPPDSAALDAALPTRRCRVISPLEFNQVRYAIGDDVPLTYEQAKPLLGKVVSYPDGIDAPPEG